jgi:hypothetical protein
VSILVSSWFAVKVRDELVVVPMLTCYLWTWVGRIGVEFGDFEGSEKERVLLTLVEKARVFSHTAILRERLCSLGDTFMSAGVGELGHSHQLLNNTLVMLKSSSESPNTVALEHCRNSTYAWLLGRSVSQMVSNCGIYSD